MTKTAPAKLPEETLESLKELGTVLMKIVRRLVSEGKAEIKDGKIILNKNVKYRGVQKTSSKR